MSQFFPAKGPTGATGPAGADGTTLTSASAQLGADVAIASMTWTDILSLSLAAGTWIIVGALTLSGNGNIHVVCRLYDGTNILEGQGTTAPTSGYMQALSPVWIVEPSITTTYKLQGWMHGSPGAAKAAFVSDVGSLGNHATSMVAIQIA